jgi:hypothetical protein
MQLEEESSRLCSKAELLSTMEGTHYHAVLAGTIRSLRQLRKHLFTLTQNSVDVQSGCFGPLPTSSLTSSHCWCDLQESDCNSTR